jgi:flagellar biosynthesis protein FliP
MRARTMFVRLLAVLAVIVTAIGLTSSPASAVAHGTVIS